MGVGGDRPHPNGCSASSPEVVNGERLSVQAKKQIQRNGRGRSETFTHNIYKRCTCHQRDDPARTPV